MARSIATVANLAETTNPVRVFDEARDSFIASLSKRERILFAPCSSADDLLEGIKKLHIIQKQSQNRKVSGCLRRIRGFSSALEPYFEIMTILVSSNPHYAALLWGALRFTLQLASNFSSFFEKLTKALERLTDAFPQYGEIALRCPQTSSKTLQDSLRKIYIDIFRFFQGVARIFSSVDGKLKRTPVVFGNLMWKPFDIRFHDLLEDMDHHREILKTQLLIMICDTQIAFAGKAERESHLAAAEHHFPNADTQKSREMKAFMEKSLNHNEETKAMMEKQYQELLFSRIQRWLSPPAFAERLEESQASREPETTSWIFHSPGYVAWHSAAWNTPASLKSKQTGINLLWAHGNPGCGKTVLAASVIDHLNDQCDKISQASRVCYFFFKSDLPDLNSPQAAYRSMLTQIVRGNRYDQDVLDRFAFAMDESTTGQITATHFELVEMMEMCLQSIPRTILVLDAIDECNNDRALTEALAKISVACSTKIILFSRYNLQSLIQSVPNEFQLTIGRDLVSKDIQSFFLREIGNFLKDGLFPPSSDPVRIVACLVNGADGMFLWARLMINLLNLPVFTPARRLKMVTDVVSPEGIEVMYDRILAMIEQSGTSRYSIAKHVCTWLLHAARPLETDEVERALMMNDRLGFSQDDRIVQFESTISLVCAGLVEFTTLWNSDDSTRRSHICRFIHLSARDYLAHENDSLWQQREKVESKRMFIPPTAVCHLGLAACCLKQILYASPSQPLATLSVPETSDRLLNSVLPFSSYAASYWMNHHLRLSTPSFQVKYYDDPEVFQQTLKNLLNDISVFLHNPKVTSAWLEMFYATNPNEARRPDAEVLCTWSTDASRFLEDNHRLFDAPNALNEMQAFSYDLAKINREWGHNLSRRPEIVWDEMGAFVKSDYFVQSETTITNFRPPQSLSRPDSTTTPLAHMSASSALSLAVLSVWPSKLFQTLCSKKKTDDQSVDLFKVSCQGWRARFEVRPLSDETALLADFQIPLDQHEVWLHVRRSLPHSEQPLEMSLPLAISRDLGMFTIMRHLFSWKPATAFAQASLDTVFISLPRNLCDETEHDCSCRETPTADDNNFCGWSVQFDRAQHYTYALTFSQNSRYLFLSDHVDFNLVVLEIQTYDRLGLSLVRSQKMPFHESHTRPVTDVVFHPRKEFLLYFHRDTKQNGGSIPGLIENHRVRPNMHANSIYMWIFATMTTNYPSLIGLAFFESEIEAVSLCEGESAALVELRSSSKVFVKLPVQALRLPDFPEIPKMDTKSQESSCGALNSMFAANTSKLSLRPGETFSSDMPKYSGHTSASMHITDGVRLSLESGNDESSRKESSVQVTALPNWIGRGRIPAALHVPTQDNSRVRIVLHQPAKLSYPVLNTQQSLFPLVVERSTAAIQARNVGTPRLLRAGNKRTSQDASLQYIVKRRKGGQL